MGECGGEGGVRTLGSVDWPLFLLGRAFSACREFRPFASLGLGDRY